MNTGRLRALERIARELNASTVAEEAHALAERAAEGRFFVACVGQFKRGKSTLINALTGANVLPTGTVPVTSVVTVLRHGEELSVRLRRAGTGWEPISPDDLPDYVTEERNPGNTKGVIAVEVFTPSPLLESGLCFVDTPGLGSVFAANTEATRDFVPHLDAALVVFGADPPISGEELSLVEEIARQVTTFVFVMNKADRVTGKECRDAAEFAARVLRERVPGAAHRLYVVSALERIATGKPTRDWSQLESHLRDLALSSGHVLVQSAVERGVARLGTRLRNILAEEVAALQRPIAETEERIRLLRQAADEAGRALWEVGPLFDAEMQRLAALFEQRRKEFIAASLQAGRQALSEAAARTDLRFGPRVRAHLFHAASEIAREQVLPWLRSSEAEAAARYREATGRFAGIVNSLLERLRTSDTWAAIPLPSEVGGNGAHSAGRYFAFNTFSHIESPAGLVPALEWLGDVLLPSSLTRRRAERAALAYYARLLVANAYRVESAIKQRLQDSRLAMESEIRYALKEVLEAAERGMEKARATQAEGVDAVRAAVARLEHLRSELDQTQQGLAPSLEAPVREAVAAPAS